MATSSDSSASDDESNKGESESEPEPEPEHGGHEHGTRANACATASIHHDFYRALFVYLAVGTGRSSVLKARLRGLGTLRNGGIFVAASNIRGAGRGLFTGQAFVKDSYVCLFGGSVMWAQEARRASEMVKHAREAGNGYIMDGTAMSHLFKQATPRWCELERRKSPAHRQKLLPTSPTGRSLTLLTFCTLLHPSPSSSFSLLVALALSVVAHVVN